MAKIGSRYQMMTLSKKTEALMTPIKHNRERIFAILLDEFDKKYSL